MGCGVEPLTGGRWRTSSLRFDVQPRYTRPTCCPLEVSPGSSSKPRRDDASSVAAAPHPRSSMRSSSLDTASPTGPSRSLTSSLEEGYAQHQLVLDRQRRSKRIEGGPAW